jgi:hypothetical protein
MDRLFREIKIFKKMREEMWEDRENNGGLILKWNKP